jgi:peptidoglycan/xylan/chitin deacetylase (PgdA/CDA1 family)
MTNFPTVVTALALLLGSSEPAPQRQPQPQPQVVAVRVPILMYHVIDDPPPNAPWPLLYVSAAEFASQMAWLDRNGYTATTLTKVWQNWHRRGTLPPHPFVLTFDDGYRSIFENALPVLSDLGWPAVVNLKVGNLGAPWGISERHVRALVAAGWELGAHTITHPDLRSLEDAALKREVAGSRAEIIRRFRVSVDFFCYPAGRYDERVLAAVRRAGFLGATTTIEGLATADDVFELRRVRVSRGDGVRRLASALRVRSAASPGSGSQGLSSDSHG